VAGRAGVSSSTMGDRMRADMPHARRPLHTGRSASKRGTQPRVTDRRSERDFPLDDSEFSDF
jgi:hypothetical protein